jgi:hypothetical protein
MLEQGLAGAELPLLDQTREHTKLAVAKEGPFAEKASDLKTAQQVHGVDPNELFKEEKEGWHGLANPSLPIHPI